MGYIFKLPHQISSKQSNFCSVTFDDGYANNRFFIDIADKFNIPFIVFLSSYNIIDQVPFLWDLHQKHKLVPPNETGLSYKELYAKIDSKSKDVLMNEAHRPLTLAELTLMAKNKWAHFGLHTHHHQPLTQKFLDLIPQEIEQNIDFLSQFEKSLLKDFSLPCGMFSKAIIKKMLNFFDRIYTIEGGYFIPGSKIIHRISLVNPEVGGSLIEQIERSFKIKNKIKNKIRRYFPFLLSLKHQLQKEKN